MRLFLIAICSVFIGACTQQSGGGNKTVLLPERDANGQYTLRRVTLSTLDSPLVAQGQAAEIYFQSPVTSEGYTGSIARPHLTLAGDTYVPLDAESSLALGVYEEMEHLYRFDQKLGVDAQIKWPRKVGVELNILAVGGTAHDNAQYFSTLDAVGLLPFSKTTDVPISLNPGIVGHEHFHAHFQSQVMNKLDHDLDRTLNFVTSLFYGNFAKALMGFTPQTDPAAPIAPNIANDPKFLNGLVLRAWNEGLADFYGSIYTDTADFFSVTLPQLASVRNLSDSPVSLGTGVQLADTVAAHPNLPVDEFVGVSYQQGTLLARALYQIAHNGTEAPEVFLKRILEALETIPPQVSPTLSTTVMDFEVVVPLLLGDFPLNRATCASLQSIVSANMIKSRFRPCLALLRKSI